MNYKNPALLKLCFLPILLVFIQSCSGGGESQASAASADGGRGRGGRGARGGDEAIAIRMAPVQRISIQRMVELSGSLVSPDQVRVSSEVAGVVATVNAELGQEIQAGQILIQLDSRELQLALERAESALRQTEAQLGIVDADTIPPDEQIASVRTAIANRDDARLKHRQAQELVAKGLLARADLDTTETRVKVAEAAVQSAIEDVRALKASLQDRRAAHELARKKLADAAVRAPVSGAISERLVQRGEFIRENTQVVTIVQLNPLKLQTAVQEKYADVIRRNLAVQFSVEPFPNEVFEGRISNISPSINQETRTFPVEILVSNPNRRLKPGFFAKGAILTQMDSNVMAIPQETISALAGVTSVYVVENGVVRQQTVTLGVQQGTLFEVVSGLQGNEILAASNLPEIITGMRVVEAASSSAPGGQTPETTAVEQPGRGERAGNRQGGGQRRGTGDGGVE